MSNTSRFMRPAKFLSRLAYALAVTAPFAVVIATLPFNYHNYSSECALYYHNLALVFALLGPASVVLGIVGLIMAEANPKRNHAIAAIVLGIVATAGVYVSIAWLSVAAQHRATGLEDCPHNLKELGVALNLYTEDWDGRFPPAGKWNSIASSRYGSDPSLLRCKGAKNNKLPSYGLNSQLDVVSLPKVQSSARTVMLFDSIPGVNRVGGRELLPVPARHVGGNNICFADTHVERVLEQPSGSNMRIKTDKSVIWGKTSNE